MVHHKTHADAPHIPPPPAEIATVVWVRDTEVAGADQDGDLVWCSKSELSDASKTKVQEWLDRVEQLHQAGGQGLPDGEVGAHLVVGSLDQ